MTRTSNSLIALTIVVGSTIGNAQCGNLPAVYSGGTYCTNGGGPMFDIVALNPAGVRVSGFDANLNAGTHSISVYTITAGGTFVGSELVPASWTLLGTAIVSSSGSGSPTHIPVTCNVWIPPGGVQGFHVRAAAGGLHYTGGGTLGGVLAATADLQILVGKAQCSLTAGGGAPFSGSTPSPRQFNGAVRYNTDFQVNRPAAGVDVDGVLATPCVAATVTKAQGAAGVLILSSTNIGSGFEVVVTLSPLVTPGAGAFVTPYGQILNVDLGSPAIAFVNGGTFPSFATPFPGTIAMGFTAPMATLTASVQMAVLDGSHPDGFVLSQAVQITVL